MNNIEKICQALSNIACFAEENSVATRIIRLKNELLDESADKYPPAETVKGLVELLRDDHKIQAIKAYREIYGCGLVIAKNKVDNLKEEMGL